MKHVKYYETFNTGKRHLIIIDCQKSFKKFFTDNYLKELNNYANEFNVIQIFDNHHDGKNPDLDYLYSENPDIENKNDLYKFNNQSELIEKRYQYDVDVDYYKNILDENIYNEMKLKEEKGELKKGDMFRTTKKTAIVFIGNNHRFFHIGIKLLNLFEKLKGKEVVFCGGSGPECFADLVISAKSIGVKVLVNKKFIYTANFCPIK